VSRFVLQVTQQVFQFNNAGDSDAECLFDFLDGRAIALAAFLAVESNHDTGQHCASRLDDINGFTDRGARGNHIINHQYSAGEISTDEVAAFTVVLGFLAIKAPGCI